MNSVLVIVLSVLIVLAAGASMVAMPWLEPRDQCFAVTIPPAASKDPALEAERRAYAIKVALLAAACGAVVGAACAVDKTGHAAVATLLATTVALVSVPFALMLAARRNVRALKAKRGWHAERQVRVAALVETDLPRPLPLALELLHLPIALLALGPGLALLPNMPERIPIHFDAMGNADNWVSRGPAAVAMPVIIIAFMAVVMSVCHLAIIRSKRASDPGVPAVTAYSYAAYTREQSLVCVMIGLAVNLAIALLPLQFAGIIPIEAWIAIMLAIAALAVGWSLRIAFTYGQNGSRAAARLLKDASNRAGADSAMSADDDAHWRLGIFYANADDPAVIVPKRFGIGWTLNWARPASWGIVAGFVLLTALFIVAIITLT